MVSARSGRLVSASMRTGALVVGACALLLAGCATDPAPTAQDARDPASAAVPPTSAAASPSPAPPPAFIGDWDAERLTERIAAFAPLSRGLPLGSGATGFQPPEEVRSPDVDPAACTVVATLERDLAPPRTGVQWRMFGSAENPFVFYIVSVTSAPEDLIDVLADSAEQCGTWRRTQPSEYVIAGRRSRDTIDSRIGTVTDAGRLDVVIRSDLELQTSRGGRPCPAPNRGCMFDFTSINHFVFVQRGQNLLTVAYGNLRLATSPQPELPDAMVEPFVQRAIEVFDDVVPGDGVPTAPGRDRWSDGPLVTQVTHRRPVLQ